MRISQSWSYKGLAWVSLFLMSRSLHAFATAGDWGEEGPVCPGRPYYVQPTETDVAETGLSREILCVITDTYLFRHDLPGPEESPDLLRRLLQQEPYKKLSKERYIAVMEEAVRLWPQSHYAHEGLARALLAGHGAQVDPAVKRRAVDEMLTAAEIAFSEGKVLSVTELPHFLSERGDKQALDNYCKRVFELIPEERGRYVSYLHYALALGELGDDRAETYFRKATEVSPQGVGEAYEFYARYLLETQQAQAVLDLLRPDSKAQDAVSEDDVFHYLRCQALEQLGRGAEAEMECRQARDLAPLTPPAGLGGRRL